jgi:PleD family two-component response regulator
VESGGSFVSGKVSLTFLQRHERAARARLYLCFLNWNFGHLIFQNLSFDSDALAASVRCNKTAGRNQEMMKPRRSGAGAPQLRLLLFGGSEQEFAELHGLLREVDEGRFYLNHAVLAEDALHEFERNNYDLLFCSSQSTDDAALQLLRQVREHDSRIPVFFLSNPVS